jgi:hypothetical protein
VVRLHLLVESAAVGAHRIQKLTKLALTLISFSSFNHSLAVLPLVHRVQVNLGASMVT